MEAVASHGSSEGASEARCPESKDQNPTNYSYQMSNDDDSRPAEQAAQVLSDYYLGFPWVPVEGFKDCIADAKTLAGRLGAVVRSDAIGDGKSLLSHMEIEPKGETHENP